MSEDSSAPGPEPIRAALASWTGNPTLAERMQEHRGVFERAFAMPDRMEHLEMLVRYYPAKDPIRQAWRQVFRAANDNDKGNDE
jgi:hypothetical protein